MLTDRAQCDTGSIAVEGPVAEKTLREMNREGFKMPVVREGGKRGLSGSLESAGAVKATAAASKFHVFGKGTAATTTQATTTQQKHVQTRQAGLVAAGDFDAKSAKKANEMALQHMKLLSGILQTQTQMVKGKKL